MHRSQHNSSRFSSVRSKNCPSPSLALAGARHGRERKPKPSGNILAKAERFALGLHRPQFTHRVSKSSSRFGKAPTLYSSRIRADSAASVSLKSASITRCEELFTNYTISEDISGSVPEQQVGSRLVALEERPKLLLWRQGIKKDCKNRKEVFRRFQTVEDEADGLEEDQGTDPSDNPPYPQSNKYEMFMVTQEIKLPIINKRMRPNTPPARSYSPFPRRDGIREKNARFEIPPERSLLNIDQLITQSSSEEEIKLLKQRKRLLRNRQAALDSRQRKKKHTEELEQEKKLWSELNIQLGDDLRSTRLQVKAAMHEKEQWQRQHLEAQDIIETLQWEKEEMVRTHTLETRELRRNISELLKQR